MGYYAASSVKFLPTFPDLEFFILAEWTGGTSGNVRKKLQQLAV